MLLGTRSMDNSVKLNLTKDQKSFVQCPKMAKQTLSDKQMILLKTLLWSRKLQFWQPCRSNPKKGRALFAQGRKMIKRFLWRKKHHLKKFQWTWKRTFEDPIAKNWTESQKLFAQCPEMMKKTYFEGKLTPEFFVLIRRKQFWRPFLKIIRQKAANPSMSKFDEKHFLHKQLILLKVFQWTRELRFWHHCQTSPKKSRVVFAECPKMINNFFSQKKTSTKQVPMELHIAVLKILSDNFGRKAKYFSLKIRKI